MNRRFPILLVALLASSHAVAAAPTPAPAAAAGGQVDALFARWDGNHDGHLSRDEFGRGWAVMQARVQLQAQFARLDANHDGAIDLKEYANVVLAKQAGASAPLSRFDSDRDQRLRFDEYVWLVEALAPRSAAAPVPAKGH